MKTIDEFIKEIEESEALQNEIKAIKDKDALADFLKKNEVDASAEEYIKAVEARNKAEGEIGDDEAEAAAGGFWGFSGDRRKYEFYCDNIDCAQYSIIYPHLGEIDGHTNFPTCSKCGGNLKKGKVIS